jgi:hypothetical protein
MTEIMRGKTVLFTGASRGMGRLANVSGVHFVIASESRPSGSSATSSMCFVSGSEKNENRMGRAIPRKWPNGQRLCPDSEAAVADLVAAAPGEQLSIAAGCRSS